MTESYKFKSKLATAISFLAAFIVYIGKDELAHLMPTELAYLAPVIVLAAGYIVTQGTENKRVDVAEQLVHEQYEDASTEPDSVVVNLTLDGEEIVSNDDSNETFDDDLSSEDDDEEEE